MTLYSLLFVCTSICCESVDVQITNTFSVFEDPFFIRLRERRPTLNITMVNENNKYINDIQGIYKRNWSWIWEKYTDVYTDQYGMYLNAPVYTKQGNVGFYSLYSQNVFGNRSWILNDNHSTSANISLRQFEYNFTPKDTKCPIDVFSMLIELNIASATQGKKSLCNVTVSCINDTIQNEQLLSISETIAIVLVVPILAVVVIFLSASAINRRYH